MTRGLFITGTDTGVGKTVLAAAVMQRYRSQLPLCYWKPIQTGIEQEDDTAVVRSLGDCNEQEILDEGVRLKRPLSPHLAAKLSDRRITIAETQQVLTAHDRRQVSWIIEGAGGVLVPISESEKMIDLTEALNLPVLIAARTSLGTINHTLLTIEALRRRALIIAGVVMVGEENSDNREAIESHGAVTILGEMPTLSNLTAKSVREWALAEFDTGGVLADHLRFAHRAREASKL
jgi:malonyl-CoA O-methyltransferase